MSKNIQSAFEYAESHHDRFLNELQDFLTIPSISGDPDYTFDVQRAAEWVANRLQALDLDCVEIFPTEGNPVVYGGSLSQASSSPTVMIYGHYDVQPGEPLEDWESPPFGPTTRGENLYGRGTSDMKGQIMACIAAVEAVKRGAGIPLNVKFLIEGEEEIGSQHFSEALTKHCDFLESDFCLNPDAGMTDPDHPAIAYSLRGTLVCVLRIFGPARDLHSGGVGGVVENPIHVLSRLIGNLHNEAGQITISGFYEKVLELSPEERLKITDRSGSDELWLKGTGVPALWGETEYSPYERTTARPALDVVHFVGGSKKMAVPASASARITFRLVPDQNPQKIYELLRAYVEKNTPDTVTWDLEFLHGYPAVLVDTNTPWIKAMSNALNAVWGVKPELDRLGGGIGAVSALKDQLNIDSVLTGFGLPEDNIHGPNEKLHLPTWQRGIEALIHFFHLLSDFQPDNVT